MALSPEAAVFADLVQLRCDGPQAFGSGLLVREGLVLTALHCVADQDNAWADRAMIGVYLFRDLIEGREVEYTARIVWPLSPRDRPADVALLAIEGAAVPSPLAPPRFAALPADQFTPNVLGFPKASAGEALPGGRVETQLFGQAGLMSASDPRIGFTSTRKSAHAGRAAWAGLSGGPLLLGGALLGVMRQVDDAYDGSGELFAEPLPPLLRDPRHTDLRRRLGVTLPLPAPEAQAAPQAAARDDIAALSAYLFTLNRGAEIDVLDDLLATADGRPQEVLVSGHPDDLCHEFWKAVWGRSLGRGGRAPPPITWPARALSRDAGERKLAREAGRQMLGRDVLPAGLAGLAPLLAGLAPPGWVCLQLPERIEPAELALLTAWRAAWAALRRADGAGFGYVLLHTAEADLPESLVLPPNAAGAPAQTRLALGPITHQEIRDWDQYLETLADANTSAPLPPLARRLRDRIPDFGMDRIRLAMVQRLLDGRAAYGGDDSASWAA